MSSATALVFSIFAKNQTGPGIAGAQSGISKLSGGLKKLGAIGAAFGGVAVFTKFINDARESAKVARLSEAVVKSTGGAANITADQMGNLATAISNKTGVDDEAIQSGENLMATFTSVRNEAGKGNDIFNQATATITDMTAALNNGDVSATGMKASSIQLGKALNDPIKGVGALSKVGVSFTEQQKKSIKTMVEAGDTMGAQKVILKELGKEFGGAAKAASDPMARLKNTLGNLSEKIGGVFLPVVDKVASFIGDKLIPIVSGLIDKLQHGGGAFKVIRDAISGVVRVFQVFYNSVARNSDANEGLKGTLGKVSRAGVEVFKAFQAVGVFFRTTVIPTVQRMATTFATDVWPAIKKVAGIVADNLRPAFEALFHAVKEQVIPAVQRVIAGLKAAAPPVMKVVGVFVVVVSYIVGKVAPVLIKLAGIVIHVASSVQALLIPIGAFFLTMKLWRIYTASVALLSGVMPALVGAFWALDAAMEANPVGLIVAGIAALIVAVVVCYKKFDWFRYGVNFIIKAVGKAWLTYVDAFLWGLQKMLQGLGHLPGPLGKPFRKGAELVGKMRDGIDGLKKKLDALPTSHSTDFKWQDQQARARIAALKAQLDSIPKVQNVYVDVQTRNTMAGSGPGAAMVGGRTRAAGGPVAAGETYLVGEEGPEFLMMGRNAGHILPNVAGPGRGAASLGSGGGGAVMTHVHVFRVEGDSADPFVAWLRKQVRTIGSGSVQKAFGVKGAS